MKAIKQNDVIDVIYDSIYGYSLEEAFKILEDHRKGVYIPIEWIEEWGWKNGMSESMSLRVMIEDWEKENENRKGEEEK